MITTSIDEALETRFKTISSYLEKGIEPISSTDKKLVKHLETIMYKLLEEKLSEKIENLVNKRIETKRLAIENMVRTSMQRHNR